MKSNGKATGVDTGTSTSKSASDTKGQSGGKSKGDGKKLTAGAALQAADTAKFSLTDEALAPVVAEAMRRWSDSFLLDEHSLSLEAVTFQIADLPDLTLGQAVGTTVLIDATAAGHGWFIDPTPSDDSEFKRRLGDGELQATRGSDAYGQIDLLTTVMHELGHVLGLEDLVPHAHEHNLMSATLDASTRRTVTAPQEAAASGTAQTSGGTFADGEGLSASTTTADSAAQGFVGIDWYGRARLDWLSNGYDKFRNGSDPHRGLENLLKKRLTAHAASSPWIHAFLQNLAAKDDDPNHDLVVTLKD